jgi:hypothetical protein
MPPSKAFVFAAYFAGVGYLFAKSGADKKLVEAYHRQLEKVARINAKALADEFANRKVIPGATS